MRSMRFILATLSVTLLLGTGGAASAFRPAAQESDEKRTFAVTCVPKGGLTEEDREIAADYLAENRDELPSAPRTTARIARASKIWTRECADAAQPVPKKLAKLLSKPADGTARFLFDRALVVIEIDSNRILSRVEAE